MYISYKLSSTKTNRFYIGMTGNTLVERMRKHRQHFREDRDIRFYSFIRSNGLDITDFEMLELFRSEDKSEVCVFETSYIKATRDKNLNSTSSTKKVMPDDFGETISKTLVGNSRRKGTKTTDKGRRNMSEAALRQPIIECPHCEKTGKKPMMSRWHFDNCKFK